MHEGSTIVLVLHHEWTADQGLGFCGAYCACPRVPARSLRSGQRPRLFESLSRRSCTGSPTACPRVHCSAACCLGISAYVFVCCVLCNDLCLFPKSCVVMSCCCCRSCERERDTVAEILLQRELFRNYKEKRRSLAWYKHVMKMRVRAWRP